MTATECPICRRAPAHPAHRPFCSARCADVDLNRWLSGAYALPAEPAAPDAAEPREPD